MRYQSRPGWCGPASIQAALRFYGCKVGQGRIADLCGCDDEGSDEEDLLNALYALGFDVHEFGSNRSYEARSWVQTLAPNVPLILCVDDWQHWVTVAGVCGERYFLFDSSRDPWNMAERGVWPLTVEGILKRWKAARKNLSEGDLFYGIAVVSRRK